MIAAFTTVIAFPLIRVVISAAQKWYKDKRSTHIEQQKIEKLFDQFSEEEKDAFWEFVQLGGNVMTWSYANKIDLPKPAVSSLMSRDILHLSATPDGMTEAFEIDIDTL